MRPGKHLTFVAHLIRGALLVILLGFAGCVLSQVPYRLLKLNYRAEKLESAERYKEALPLRRQLLAEAEALPHRNPNLVGRFMARLGAIYWGVPNYIEGTPLLLRGIFMMATANPDSQAAELAVTATLLANPVAPAGFAQQQHYIAEQVIKQKDERQRLEFVKLLERQSV